jgi:drug/metabolite transporter (DMT)-like permease
MYVTISMVIIINKYRAYILAAAFLWGGTGIFFVELSARGANPVQVVLVRTGLAALGLGLWLLAKDRSAFRVRIQDIWCFAGTGLISLLFFNWCYIQAIQEAGMAVSGVLLYTAPAFVTILSAFLFREKLTLPGWGILALVLLGCALVSGVMGAAGAATTTGILFGLGAGFGYALYSIFGRYALNRGYSPLTVSFYTFAMCAMGCIPLASVWELPDIFAAPGALPHALALGTLGCLFPFWLYTKGLAGTTGAKASMTATLEPVVAAAFGILLYREALTPWQIAGMALVLGGIVLLGGVSRERGSR